jgi:hypothetical protein
VHAIVVPGATDVELAVVLLDVDLDPAASVPRIHLGPAIVADARTALHATADRAADLVRLGVQADRAAIEKADDLAAPDLE